MKRDRALDYIRIILTLMIVVFHFCEANGFYSSKFFVMSNGTWGWVATSSFILLSGYLLRKLYGNLTKHNVGSFYKKRMLSLFPSFYIAFIICFIIHSIYLGSPLYGGHPFKIIFSILGIDSYVGLYGISTYAVVGEWFTGLIIMLYLLFPLLNYLMNKAKIVVIIVSILLFGLYIANAFLQLDPTISDASVITGVFIFWCGMLIYDNSEIITKFKPLAIIFIACYITLAVMPIPGPRMLISNAMGLLLFISLLIVFSIKIPGNRKAEEKSTSKSIVSYLSIISYEVYLVHHFVLYKAAAFVDTHVNRENLNSFINSFMCVAFFICLLGLILMFAALIHFISDIISDKLKRLLKI